MTPPAGYRSSVRHLSSALRPYALAIFLALASALVAVVVAVAYDLPLRDPDSIAGPAYIRLPAAVLVMVVIDVIPRAIRRRVSVRTVIQERYGPGRIALVAVGLAAFYVSYVSYRNLKGALPLARPNVWDYELTQLDRLMAFGNDPAIMLHQLLGTGVTAYVLSAVYLGFLGFVPFSLGIALVWSRSLWVGAWYVTAMCLNWVGGALSYYLVPSLGPVFVRSSPYTDLPPTGAGHLAESLADHRLQFLADPHGADVIASVAGFASLHVSITFTVALIAHRIGLPRGIRWSMWAFLVFTMTATIYFGWHYLVDDIAGLGIGALAVVIGQRVTRRISTEEELALVEPMDRFEESAAA